MEHSYKCGMRVRRVMKKTVMTSSTSSMSSERECARKRNLVAIKINCKGQPFPRHDVKMFPREAYSSMSSESFSSHGINNNYSSGSVKEQSVTTKMIGGGEHRRFIEHFTKSFGHGDEQPIVVVMRNRSPIDVPKWMEERKSLRTEHPEVDISNINVFMKYPSDNTSRKKEPDDKVKERKIHSEVSKRNKQVIPVFAVENDDKDNEPTVTTKTIGGSESRSFIEHFTKSSDHVQLQPIEVVIRHRSRIEVPEWMEEQKSPGKERQDVDISNIDVLLNYSTDYYPGKKELEDKVFESKIHPEIAKRDKQVVTVFPTEEDTEENEPAVTTKTIKGGKSRKLIEHFTKSSRHSELQPIEVVIRHRSQINVPEWMEESTNPGKEHPEVDISNINVFLKYPSNYTSRKTDPDDKVTESKIHPEVAKRDKQVIPVLPVEEDDEDKEWSVTTKRIGGGESRRFNEHFTKSYDHGDEQPIVVVMRNRSRIDVPEWMQERKSPETEQEVDISKIDVFLKYTSDFIPETKTPEKTVNESKIHPEVAKRGKQFIPVLPVEEDGKDKEWLVTTKMIGGGESRRFIEHITKSPDHGDKQPIVVVMRNRSHIDVPEWMEERKLPGKEHREVDISNINVFLKYPSDFIAEKKELGEIVNESKIYPEVAKRDNQVIPVLPVEQDDEDDEEESEEEYDEFEEEIIVMDVRRKPVWRKGLEIPKPQPEKVGRPIEDLLEIPTLQAKQESVPDALLIDEKIEFLARPPVVHAEMLDFLENL